MALDIRGKGVVITGAGGGIGSALAERMAAQGARLVLNDLDASAVEAVAERVGGVAVPGDAASEDGVANLIEAGRAALGRIDIFFANAGVEMGHGLDAPEAEWSRSLDINLMAHVRAARLLIPDWLETGGGRFIVTASAAGLLTSWGSAPYAVSKHAAESYAEWLSVTYGHRGIVVQAICPQAVNTPLLAGMEPVKELLKDTPPMEPADLATAVWEGMQDDRFLILPHPEVAGFYSMRASAPDKWLAGMRRLQMKLDSR